MRHLYPGINPQEKKQEAYQSACEETVPLQDALEALATEDVVCAKCVELLVEEHNALVMELLVKEGKL